ncbi:MAG: single-stranded DNA-binding protein [Candidatus Nealsonbacteria bacterium]|nr:single-stranded DNA-binding protein [Candidatus Nealsonbacteria bacterium]
MNFNKVILIGRLTRDPETRSLPSGQSVVNFGMATTNFFTDKSGQKQQQTEFHNIVLFGRLADIASQYLNKGSLVLIEGRLQTRTWQDSSGNKRSRTEIIAQSLQLGPRTAGKVVPPGEETEKQAEQEDIPVIEEEEIDIKDIPL